MLKIKVVIENGVCIGVTLYGTDEKYIYEIIDLDDTINGDCPYCHSNNVNYHKEKQLSLCNECSAEF